MNIVFDYFKETFNKNGFRLYMVGGTSRDYLLNLKIADYDFVTDATPSDIEKFLDANFTFKKYGCVKAKYLNNSIDIVTLREEGNYIDYRHPSYIKFVKDIEQDYRRRDFTINAIYIDEKYNIIDPTGFGVHDLKNKILRLIGPKDKRLKEDPLRILRAERFVVEYNLKVESETKKALEENFDLIKYLNKDKVDEEKRKLLKIEENKNENKQL